MPMHPLFQLCSLLQSISSRTEHTVTVTIRLHVLHESLQKHVWKHVGHMWFAQVKHT